MALPGILQRLLDHIGLTGTSAHNSVLKTTFDAAFVTTRDDVAKSYKSAGTGAAATGFLLSTAADIGSLFGKLDGVENAAATGSGNYMNTAGLTVNGKNVRLTQNKVGPSYCVCNYNCQCQCACNCQCECNCQSNCYYDCNCGDN